MCEKLTKLQQEIKDLKVRLSGPMPYGFGGQMGWYYAGQRLKKAEEEERLEQERLKIKALNISGL